MDCRLATLHQLGQSIWLDYIDRSLLESGELAALIELGVTGVTTNPTIFHQAITSGERYDRSIRDWHRQHPDAETDALLDHLMVEDVTAAADLLAPAHARSGGRDGLVSIEVSPLLAHDTEATLEQARRLYAAAARPNVMVKIPATDAGLPAIEQALAEGMQVNVTLLFGIGRYREVMTAWHRGLEQAESPQQTASVASFFISRIDTRVDAELKGHGGGDAARLRGRIAIANARLAYQAFTAFMNSDAVVQSRERGVPLQRLLFGSTGTKNPDYSDIRYVEALIGRDTVNTLPPATLQAFLDHGTPSPTLPGDLDAARRDLAALTTLGIDLEAITSALETEGVAAFGKSYRDLLEALERRRQALAAA